MSPPIFVSWEKNTANICDTFCRAQKILQKLAQKQTKKFYDNRKYLRYTLRIAKISVNISDVFLQIAKNTAKNTAKKTYGSYMQPEVGQSFILRSNFDQNKDHMGIPASEGI